MEVYTGDGPEVLPTAKQEQGQLHTLYEHGELHEHVNEPSVIDLVPDVPYPRRRVRFPSV